MARQRELDVLLELDGVRIVMEDGSYAKFEVSIQQPSPERPHGIRYSLTYHDKFNQRLIGFDNAHAPPKLRRRKFGGRRSVAHDHQHLSLNDKGQPYEFESPGQLISDFWNEVAKWQKKQEGRS